MQFIKNLFKKEPLHVEQITPGKWAAVTPAGVVKRLFYSDNEVAEFLARQEKENNKNLEDMKK